MSISEILQLVSFLMSLLSTGLAAFAARIANKTRAELQTSLNAEGIALLNKRLDEMDIADGINEKTGEQVRIRLVGLSGDNGLVHDIIKMKGEIADLLTRVSVISDRLQIEIGKREESGRK